MDTQARATVEHWHQLLNDGHLDGLLALVARDVEVGGPRGTGRGSRLVEDWFGRAGVRLVPRRVFQRGDVVVVEEEGTWPAPGGEGEASTALTWSLFAVAGAMITRIVRFDSLSAALAAAGLDPPDEVAPPG